MEIQTLKISEINPAVYNPRKDLQPGDPEYEKLKKSILEFDMVEPLIYNRQTGNLVGGHQRLKILKELGHAEVEVSIVDLPAVKEKALNLALNKISGEWDFPKLKDLLEELDTGDFDMEITGFDLKEIEELMTQFHVPGEGLTDDDEVPEPTESISKRGDLWQLGNHRLLCGDATKKEDVERLMGGEKINAIVTDPPYGMNLDTDWSGIGRTGRKDSKLPHYIKGKAYPKVIGDEQSFNPQPFLSLWADGIKEAFLFGADYYMEMIPNRNDGSLLVWDKRLESQADGFGSEFETIWSMARHKRRLLRHEWFGFLRGSEQGQKRVHPTQKPIALFVDIIQQWINGMIIADPFGGSGSTLIACEKLGRRCFMMEIDEHYCDVIIKRWEDFTSKLAVRIDGKT